MTTILLTGVTGFAGSNLVRYFHGIEGFKLLGHSRDRKKAEEQFKHLPITFIDEITPSLLDEKKVDCVVHLAGIAHDLSNKFVPEDYYRVNDMQTRSVYDQFLQAQASCFIYLSSIKAAVDVASSAITEDVIPVPFTDYGKSKAQAEAYIQRRPLADGKRVYILRPCMIHGPGNKGNLNLLYRFVKAGLPFPFGAVTNQRSFLNVDNFNYIIHRLIDSEIASGVYHLSDTGYLSTAELVRLIARALNKNPKILVIPHSLIKLVFTGAGQRRMFYKLTEDMMVSNDKLLQAIKAPLPVSLQDGVVKTIRSFHQ